MSLYDFVVRQIRALSLSPLGLGFCACSISVRLSNGIICILNLRTGSGWERGRRFDAIFAHRLFRGLAASHYIYVGLHGKGKLRHLPFRELLLKNFIGATNS
jgi:hypothetical protein